MGNSGIYLPINRLLMSAIVVVVAVVVYLVLRKFYKRYQKSADPSLNEKKTWVMVVYSLLRILVIACAIIAILSIFGVDVTGAVAGLGIVGAGAVLAVQDLLKDLIMGVTIASERYFSLDDVVDYNGYIGKVVSLTTRSTKIQSLYDHSVRSVSNHLLTDITVLSHAVNIHVPLPYDLHYQTALDILEKICTHCCREIKEVERCVSKGANYFNDSSISYLIVLYCDPAGQLDTRRAVIRVIQEELALAGIQIPFPQLDVHTKH